MTMTAAQLAIAQSAISSAIQGINLGVNNAHSQYGASVPTFTISDIEGQLQVINAAMHSRVAAMMANLVAQNVGSTPCIAACLPGSYGGANASCIPGNMGTGDNNQPNTKGCFGTLGTMASMMAAGEGPFNGMGIGLGKVDFGMILQPLYSFMVAGVAIPMQVLDQLPAAFHYVPSIEQQILADTLIINASMYALQTSYQGDMQGDSGNGASVNEFMGLSIHRDGNGIPDYVGPVAQFTLGRDLIQPNGKTSSSSGDGVSHMYLQPISPTDDEFENEGGLAKYLARGGYLIQRGYATGAYSVLGGSRGLINDILGTDQNKLQFNPTWPTGYCSCTNSMPTGYTQFPNITTPIVTQWQQSRGDGTGFSVYITTANSAVGAGNDGGNGYMIEIAVRSVPWYQEFLSDVIGWIKDFERVICSLEPQAQAAVAIADAPMCVDKNNKPCRPPGQPGQPISPTVPGTTLAPISPNCVCTSVDVGQAAALVGAEVAFHEICGQINQTTAPPPPVTCPMGFMLDYTQNVCVPITVAPVADTGMSITTVLLLLGAAGLAYFAFKE